MQTTQETTNKEKAQETERTVVWSIRPLANRITIKLEEIPDTSPGGIIIPDTTKDKPHLARVVAVGPGQRNLKGTYIPPDVEIGDLVVVEKHAPVPVPLPGERVADLHTILEGDIICVLEPTVIDADGNVVPDEE